MSTKNNGNPTVRKKRLLRWILIPIVSLAALAAAAVGTVYIMLGSVSAGSVPIVSAPIRSAAPTPVPTPALSVITGTPQDLGEDYYYTPAPATPGPSAAPTATPTPVPIYQVLPEDINVINVLVVGRDARPAETGTGRSDSMMLLSYNRKTGHVSIVSLMRDTWVPIEGLGWERLNASYSYGGIGLLINTVNSLFALDIQDYVEVNFAGMSELVDYIGGVDVTVNKAEAARYASAFNWHVIPGLVHMDGAHALTHARDRYSGGGDFERVRRQQDIMLAVYKKLKAEADPATLAKLTSFMMKNVKTNLPPDEILSLALELVGKKGIVFDRGRVPVDKSWQYANKDGRSVITIDFDMNKKYLQKMIYSGK